MKMPLTERGNQYVIVFMDYLTKWVEAYAPSTKPVRLQPGYQLITLSAYMGYLPSCQTGARICSLCRRCATCWECTRSIPPRTILSAMDLWRTLIGLCKQRQPSIGPSWDVHLQQVLFAYQARPHSSTGESPFYMVYGRDPHLPTETAFSTTHTQQQGDAEDYCAELTRGLTKHGKWRNRTLARRNNVRRFNTISI